MSKYFRIIFNLLVTAFVMLLPIAASSQSLETITSNDNSTQEFEVPAVGKNYFSDDNHLFIDNGEEMPIYFDVANIKIITFSEVSSIQEIVTELFKVFPNPVHDNLFVVGENLENIHFALNFIDGRLLKNGVIHSDEAINLTALPIGINILKIDNKTLKINKI